MQEEAFLSFTSANLKSIDQKCNILFAIKFRAIKLFPVTN
jgi:hypothetical protein